MKVFYDVNNGFTAKFPVVTIGTFDGVHLGHQKILQKINKEAEKIGGESVLFTFHPHPRIVLNPKNHNLKLLQTQGEKISKLERFGLQNLIVYPFTEEFSNLTAMEFVRDILVEKMKVKTLVIGYDHQFGKNREGGIEFLQSVSKEFGFTVIEIPAQEIDDVNVSSTKIRNALLEGNIVLANSFLKEPFELEGKVIKGEALGRKLGFPTANLNLQTDLKLIPKNGVYAVHVTLNDGRLLEGIMNIGSRPTIHANGQLSLEVYLLDFNEDLYGQILRVQFLEHIRSEKAFANTDELIDQIKQDEIHVRHIFNSISKEFRNSPI
ncbi:MAG: bifunctional riboflavin kinase/FAD synthetase [Bacteroidota bacterium]